MNVVFLTHWKVAKEIASNATYRINKLYSYDCYGLINVKQATVEEILNRLVFIEKLCLFFIVFNLKVILFRKYITVCRTYIIFQVGRPRKYLQ